MDMHAHRDTHDSLEQGKTQTDKLQADGQVDRHANKQQTNNTCAHTDVLEPIYNLENRCEHYSEESTDQIEDSHALAHLFLSCGSSLTLLYRQRVNTTITWCMLQAMI